MRFITTSTPAGRLEYFAVIVAMWAALIAAVLVLLAFEFDTTTQSVSYSQESLAAFAFLVVGLQVVGLINVLRRMKDLHMGGAWFILHFVPIVNVFFHLMLLFSSGVSRSTYAPYGDNPYNPDSWVAKPTPGQSSGPAVTFQGQALLLPGEDGWKSEDEAA